jgi:PAS domain S-box-containing protein
MIVTPLKKAEQALRKSEAKYRELVENANGLILRYNSDGKITFVNECAQTFFGYSEEEIMGKDVMILVPEQESGGRSLKTLASDILKYPDKFVEYENENILKNGTRMSVSWRNKAIKDSNGNVIGNLAVGQDVTARKKAEEAIKASTEKYETLLNSIDEGFCVIEVLFDASGKAKDYRFLETNPAFEEHTGLHKAQGRLVRDMVPEHEEHWFETYGRIALTGKPEHFESEAKALNRYYEVYAFRIGEAENHKVAVLFKDITGRKQAEESLRESEEQFRAILETSPVSIGVVDPATGIFMFVNPAYEKALGYYPGELLGRKTLVIYENAADRERVLQVLKERGHVSDFELKIKRKDGSIFWALFSIRPITYGGKPALLGTSIDITELKQIEQLKDEFIGLVSHELKTPLTVISSSLHTARDKRLSPEDRSRLLEDAAWGVQSLDNILNNLLELSRHQADRLKLDKEATIIREIVEKAVLTVGSLYPKHRVLVDISSGIPATIVDPVRLGRILHNLIDNACKYSSEGSEVMVFARRKKDKISIGVSDQGKGIAPEDQESLFEPFSRVESNIRGIGLGLVVCKRLVEAHGGRIWVESKPGQGSTFLFTIPIEGEKPQR